jgi:hypothetical protein
MEDVYFNELQFTDVCKTGFLYGEAVSKLQMKNFISEGFMKRTIKYKEYKIHLPNLEYELFKGIVERSPIYSDLTVPLPNIGYYKKD